MDQEKRRFKRIPFNTAARIVTAVPMQLIDISLKGALVTRPSQWKGALGDVINIEIPLDSGEALICMEMRVAHVDAERLGLVCLHIDLNSITHLRRLVELNLGDDELLHRELTELGT